MNHSKKFPHLALKACGLTIMVLLLFSFIDAQYARAVGTHKVTAPLSLEMKHPVKELMQSRFYRGDMINSFQRNQFSVTVLCPQELGLLIRQIARIHLCGLTAGIFRIFFGVAALRVSLPSAVKSILLGATVSGVAMAAPECIRALALWSLGYAPF